MEHKEKSNILMYIYLYAKKDIYYIQLKSKYSCDLYERIRKKKQHVINAGLSTKTP